MRVRCSSGLDVESYSGHCYRCVLGGGCGDGGTRGVARCMAGWWLAGESHSCEQ